MNACPICNHKKRDKIEQEVNAMQFSSGDDTNTLHKIAEKYKVKYNDLLIHTVMHISTADDCNIISTKENAEDTKHTSLASSIKRKEADILQSVLEDQTATFKNLSLKINSIVSNHTEEKPTLQQLSKSVVDLYLGTGQAIRSTVDTITKMNLVVNGEKNDGLSSLAGLVQVLKDGD